jgi:long-chain acyl-CoA synthetase
MIEFYGMESLVSRFLRLAEAQPEATAVIDRGQHQTYGELGLRVRATAASLHSIGVRAGDTVAIAFDTSSRNSLAFLHQVYALAYLGAAVLPFYPEVPPSRHRDLIARFGARWWISTDARERIAGATPIDVAACTGKTLEGPDTSAPRTDDPERPFLHSFTSGTTGEPKVLLFTQGQFSGFTFAAAAAMGWKADDRLVPARAWPTLVALRYLFRIHAAGGAFVNERFPENRQELAWLVQHRGVTILTMSPWQARRLLRSDAPPGTPWPQLRMFLVNGAYISAAEILQLRRSITPNVYVAYGTTEAGLIALLRPGDVVEEGGAGTLVSPMQAQAADSDGRHFPPGKLGNLGFRAPWIPPRYLGNDEATAAQFRDGWFYPGDVGSVTAEGIVSLRGRSDEIINYGGVKIQPADVEAVLCAHPDVKEAALVGIADPMAGELAIAFVVLRRAVSDDELRKFCATRIDVPRVPVGFIAIDKIPRNAEGKILREPLREHGSALARSAQATSPTSH